MISTVKTAGTVITLSYSNQPGVLQLFAAGRHGLSLRTFFDRQRCGSKHLVLDLFLFGAMFEP
jgi:hypothetical protein